MKKIGTILIISFLLLACTWKKDKKAFKIGVIQWAEHPALVQSYEGMLQSLEENNVRPGIQIEYKNANEEVHTATMIASQFINQDVDLIYAIATPAVQASLSARNNKDIPIVFAAVSDPVSAGLVKDPKKPENNITGVSDIPPLDNQLSLMKNMIPHLHKIGVIYNTGEINSINQINDVKQIAERLDLDVVAKGISSPNEISHAAKQLAVESDSLFIINDNMTANAAGLLVDIFSKENKAVFMAEDGQFDQGILASDSVSYERLGQQAGNMIVDILFKEKSIMDIPIETAKETRLIINQEIAEQLDIKIPQSIQEKARIE